MLCVCVPDAWSVLPYAVVAGWPHNVVLGKDDHIESPDSVIFSKVQRLAEQQKAGKAEPVSVSPYKSATATGFNFS